MVAVTNIQQIITLADTITGWGGPTPVLDTEIFLQGIASANFKVGKNVLAAIPFTPAANINMTANYTVPHLYWAMRCDVFAFCELLNTGATNSGLMVRVTDGAGNFTQWHVAGSDTWGGAWKNFVLDLTNTANIHSSSGTLSLADVDIITWYVDNSNSGNIRAIANTWIDSVRYGEGLQAESTTTEAFDFLDIALDDALTANWYGVFQKESGILASLGSLIIGDSAGTANANLLSTNELVVFQNFIVDNGHYNITGIGNATGSTDIDITGAVWSSDELTAPDVDFSDTNLTSVVLQGTMLKMGTFVYQSGITCSNITYVNCGQITPDGADIRNSSISGYAGLADSGVVIYNNAADPDGEFDGMSITKGSASAHAIEFGLAASETITLRNIDFSGYNASNDATDSTFLVKRTTGTTTINIVGGSGNVSYKSLGATVNVVLNPVTTSVTVKDIETQALISGARVFIEVSSGVNFPYQAAVTATRAGAVVTVTHTAHGLTTGNKIRIAGADDNSYNGIKTITVTGVNTYTYAIAATPVSPAAGSLTATMVIISGVTDGSGYIADTRSYSSSQPIIGRVRQASGAGLKYITQPISDTISNATGLPLTVQLVSDE